MDRTVVIARRVIHDKPVTPCSQTTPHVSRLGIPIWREGRAALETIELYRRRRPGRAAPRGDGQPVLLIPGYLSGDRTLGRLASWLRQIGYAPEHSAIAANVDCATRTTERLIQRSKAITDAHGEHAVMVGHSLGGVLGRVLALRHPELVRGVVCLGSPLVSLNGVHPLVAAHVRIVSVLDDLGVPGLLSRGCLTARAAPPLGGSSRPRFSP